MTWQTIVEISNPFDVYVKGLGEGVAMFMTVGSITCNPQFLVRLENGFLRTVDQNDLIVYGNPSAGQKLVPDIPREWKSDREDERMKKIQAFGEEVIKWIEKTGRKEKTDFPDILEQVKMKFKEYDPKTL